MGGPDAPPTLPATDTPFRLDERSVEVWALRVDACAAQTDALARLLSADERQRADRYRVAAPRTEFIVTRAALRHLLGARLNLDPAELRLTNSAGGKPALADGRSGLAFNVSHSGGIALLAFARQGSVGIDIEACRALNDLPLLAARVFDSADAARWRALPAAQQQPAFYRAWTRKEACAKADGRGLGVDVRDLHVALDAGRDGLPGSCTALGETADWALYDIDLGADHAAALACSRGVAPAAPLRWLDLADLQASSSA